MESEGYHCRFRSFMISASASHLSTMGTDLGVEESKRVRQVPTRIQNVVLIALDLDVLGFSLSLLL